ncbi:MAG: hypothetical protein H6564_12260 [Lewinellaceae bacterium]|nr:hypothetical protein [Lewinellaceae bacterium]
MKQPLAVLKALSVCTALLACTVLNAQADNLRQDSTFFNQQKTIYQRWLNQSGLGPMLQVEGLSIKEDRISLYLSFPSSDINFVVRSWESLKQNFEAERPITLEQQLFYKMISLMEVRQSMADVQIYDTYDLRREPLFFRGIYFEDGQVKVEENNPKSKIEEVPIFPANLRGMKDMSEAEIREAFSREAVYEKVLEYARGRYGKAKCEQRYPMVRVLENGAVLRFEVEDLCREVLTDEANPLLARILNSCCGLNYNWVKRELLNFIITYREFPDGKGFILTIEIDGKYGSGIYDKVRRGGYLSMEVDFDDYLERYADSFKEAIRKAILKK